MLLEIHSFFRFLFRSEIGHTGNALCVFYLDTLILLIHLGTLKAKLGAAFKGAWLPFMGRKVSFYGSESPYLWFVGSQIWV